MPTRQSLLREYRWLAPLCAGGHLNRLFADLTGRHLKIARVPSPPLLPDAQALPKSGSNYSRVARRTIKSRSECDSCGQKQFARALAAKGDGLVINCWLGVRIFWLPIRVGEVTVGLARLQSVNCPQPGKPPKNSCAPPGVSTMSDFRHAIQLLRLMIQHVLTFHLCESRQSELGKTSRLIVALEKEQARLHEAIKNHLPAPRQVQRRTKPESHPEQLVNSLLDSLSRNYAQPITLQCCAAELKMNAAYLSALFSRAVGRSFKSCLTALRMDRAQVLLGDPRYNISEIAAAVGYATPNRFRLAFKQAFGLSPRAWRETMQVISS